ncbi:MAG: hypothetical protein HC842_04980 [Cytophagales bacterium]|nr:hypothetical protein [Cytophagales bacterium]
MSWHNPPTHLSTAPARDAYWEDGWELLWMNLGKFPNGDLATAPRSGTYYEDKGISFPPDPPSVPYFVLYNRYTGLLRLFVNIWFKDFGGADDIWITLKYLDTDKDETQVSSVLRHASSYDQALDTYTSMTEHHTVHSHPTTTPN